MRLCVVCGDQVVGGRCPPCDRSVCYGCSVKVLIGNESIAFRCKLCAAAMVLSGEGRVE